MRDLCGQCAGCVRNTLGLALAAGIAVAGCSSASTHSTAPAGKPAATRAATPQVSAPAKAPAAAKLTAAQTAAMNAWYSGATVNQVASVCGDVFRVYSDNNAVNSGTGSSSLQGDITRLQTDVAAALGNPPPVSRDAVIWERVLNAYSNAAGDPTNAGLVAAVRRADRAAWRWTPSFGGTLLSCLNTTANP
jgi:hypothetical protein